MSQLTRSAAWKAMREHRTQINQTSIRARFDADPNRVETFARRLPGVLVDFSKHRIRIDLKTLGRLVAVLRAQALRPGRHLEHQHRRSMCVELGKHYR